MVYGRLPAVRARFKRAMMIGSLPPLVLENMVEGENREIPYARPSPPHH